MQLPELGEFLLALHVLCPDRPDLSLERLMPRFQVTCLGPMMGNASFRIF
jgi:hypothetical protein